MHRPTCFWRWETAEQEYLCILGQEGLKRVFLGWCCHCLQGVWLGLFAENDIKGALRNPLCHLLYCAVVIFDDTFKEIKGDMISSGKMELTKRGTQAAYTLYKTEHDDSFARYIIGEFYNSDIWVYFEINDNHYHLNDEANFTQFFNTVDVTKK